MSTISVHVGTTHVGIVVSHLNECQAGNSMSEYHHRGLSPLSTDQTWALV